MFLPRVNRPPPRVDPESVVAVNYELATLKCLQSEAIPGEKSATLSKSVPQGNVSAAPAGWHFTQLTTGKDQALG